MKLKVDGNKCQGHGRCYAIAPDLFIVDKNGNASARVSEVPEDRKDAELAAANCPESAITVTK
jgi:ferredoxin